MLRDILYLVIGLIVGVLAGFFISKKLVSKQLKENFQKLKLILVINVVKQMMA